MAEQPLPAWLRYSEESTLDLWEWTVDVEAECAVREAIARRGGLEVVPVGRLTWSGTSNPGEPLEQRGAIWRAVDLGFPPYQLDHPERLEKQQRERPFNDWPWTTRSRKQHHPVFRYCVYCGATATHNILKQTYCAAHYALANEYHAWYW